MNAPTPRQAAPELSFKTLDGDWNLAAQQPEQFSLILFYRGLHCPICKAQLRDLDRKLGDFEALGVEVVAVSGDIRERAEQARSDWSLENLDIGYGVSEETAREWGLYISEGIKEGEPERFFEPGLFLVRPGGELFGAAIQSMPFTRPSFSELLGAIGFIKENDYPARGEA